VARQAAASYPLVRLRWWSRLSAAARGACGPLHVGGWAGPGRAFLAQRARALARMDADALEFPRIDFDLPFDRSFRYSTSEQSIITRSKQATR
jgi:hypothetical protein